MGNNFDRGILIPLMQEKYPLMTDYERTLMVEVVTLQLDKEHRLAEIASLQLQVATQAHELLNI